MYIIDAISGANHPAPVYFLLTAYVEAITHDPPHPVPAWALQLPLTCRHDVTTSLVALGHYGRWSHVAPTAPERRKIAEAIAVFRAALDRIDQLYPAGSARTALTEACSV